MNQSKVAILKAIADDTRLNIVQKLMLADQPVPSCDIVSSCATFLKLSQPAMSHHFNKLVDAGVLVVEKQGTQNKYKVDTAALAAVGIDATKL